MAKKKSKSEAPVPSVGTTPSTTDVTIESRDAPAATVPAESTKPATKAASGPSNEMVLSVLAVLFSVLVGAGVAHWVLLLCFLVSSALLLLGAQNAAEMWTDFRLQYDGDGRLCVPITDASFDIDTANKFANSCQVREKGLKILQYVLRLGAYTDVVPAASKALKGLSKTTSIARRFFKFCRWVKHFEDLAEAKDEKDFVMRVQLFIRVAANFGADWAEDVCSLERIGILPKGTLSVEFMLFAEYCQLVLALVEVSVTSAKLRKEEEKTAKVTAGGAPKDILKQGRKLALTRLELVKFVSDIGKAVVDCELRCGHEGVFIGCSLFSALVSVHKNMFMVCK